MIVHLPQSKADFGDDHREEEQLYRAYVKELSWRGMLDECRDFRLMKYRVLPLDDNFMADLPFLSRVTYYFCGVIHIAHMTPAFYGNSEESYREALSALDEVEQAVNDLESVQELFQGKNENIIPWELVLAATENPLLRSLPVTLFDNKESTR